MSKKSRMRKEKVAAAAGTAQVAEQRRDTRLLTLLFTTVVVLFFASGFSSLIYQVVWTRMLVLVFGATTFATSTVLAIFMGGLALGSFVAGRYADKLKRPLFWYGILEAVIGGWALCTPLLFEAATPVYRAVWQATHAGLLELSLVRFVCTLLILIVPTTCMGATLPILARFVTNSLESVGDRVGTLYSINTLGAVVGAITTGFLILPAVGLRATIVIAALINAFLLFAVVALEKWVVSKAASEEVLAANQPDDGNVGMRPDSEANQSHPLSMPLPLKLAVGVFAVSGGIAMIYEVCWTRTLLMVIGSSTYAFTVMLSAFLIGIFLGSLVCAKFIDRAKRPLLWFAIFQLCIAAATLVSMRAFNQVPHWNIIVSYGAHGDSNVTMFVRFLLAGAILAPITLFLGAIFPTVVKACTTDLARVGRSIGFLYSANTLGAIVGAFLAGFVCLPLWGAEKTLIYSSVLNAVLGLVLLWVAVPMSPRPKLALTGCSVGVLAFLLFSSTVWDKNVLLNAQAVRRGIGLGKFDLKQVGTFEQWRDRLNKQSEVRYWADGACSNVGVVYHPSSKVTSLMTNGHIDASDGFDMPVQALISGFAMLTKPDAKEIAVVGWGCGQTVAMATQFPIKSLDAIELEPLVIEASKHFHHLTGAPEKDPRVHLHYNDGRNFLLATDKKYDAIMSEPSNPWQSGVCNLFTKEYFSICKARLKEDGILSLWIQTGEVPPSNLCAVLGAVSSEFKHALIFVPRPGNLVVVASEKPLNLDFPRIHQILESNPKLKNEFARADVVNAADVVAHLVVADDGMRNQLVAPFINTDDNNRLEFDVGKTYEDALFGQQDFQVLQSLSTKLPEAVDFKDVSKRDRAIAMAHIAEFTLNRTEYLGAAEEWCNASIALEPTIQAYKMLAACKVRRNQLADAASIYAKAVALDPKDVESRLALGSILVAMNKLDEGRAELEKCLAQEPKNDRAAFALATSYSHALFGAAVPRDDPKRKMAEKVIALVQGIADDDRKCREWPNTAYVTGQAYMVLGDMDKARSYIRRFQAFAPKQDAERAESMIKMIDLQSAATGSSKS
jgi:spermidine synthase